MTNYIAKDDFFNNLSSNDIFCQLESMENYSDLILSTRSIR